MKPMSRRTDARGLVALIALVVLTVTGCAQPLRAGSGPAEGDTQDLIAQEQVADLARDISAERRDDIDGWARAAVASAAGTFNGSGANIELIGIRSQQSIDPNEPFGHLEFRVPVPDVENASARTPDAYCFEVEFNYYGKVGTWESSDGVDPVDCPPNAAVVAPPVDESIVALVAANAREVTTAVLLERAQTGMPATEDAIVAAIAGRLESPTGDFEVVDPPRVVIKAGAAGDRIGVAFGTADDCVLVKSENGEVEDVYPAPITLQPGELGCTPETAIADPDQLRSPH